MTGPSQDPDGLYAALGVGIDADQAQIRRAFLQRSTMLHTDRHASLSEEGKKQMNERFQALNEAYQTLADERKRYAYDHSGTSGVDKLALVPASLQSHSDIRRALDALEMEEKIQRLVASVSASGECEVSFNVANSSEEADGEEDPILDSSESSEQPAQMPNATEMQAHIVEVSGQKRLVLVPPPAVMRQILQGIPQEARQQVLSQLQGPPATKQYLPQSLKVTQSFSQPLVGGATAEVKTSAIVGQQTKASSAVEFIVKGAIQTYHTITASLKVGLMGVKLSIQQSRRLSPLWELGSKFALRVGATGAKHGASFSLRRFLGERTFLNTTVNMSPFKQGSCEIGLTDVMSDNEHYRGAAVKIGPGTCAITVFANTKVEPAKVADLDCSLNRSLSLDVLQGTTTANGQLLFGVSEFSSVGFGVLFQAPLCPSPFAPPLFLAASQNFSFLTQYQIILKRGDYGVTFPIVVALSSSPLWPIISGLSPFALFFFGLRTLAPVLRGRTRERVSRIRKSFEQQVEKDRSRAMEEQETLKADVQRLREREGSAGLVIQNAKYGVLHPEVACDTRDLFIDVTVPLQSYVVDSKLELPAGDRFSLVGFCDVDPGTAERRVLHVTYWYRGSRHEVEVADGDTLTLPQRAHRAEQS